MNDTVDTVDGPVNDTVDGTVNDIGELVRSSGRGLSHIQTGRVQNYAFGIALGLLAMVAAFLLVAVR